MDAPNTSPYILATPDNVNLPSSRTLETSGGLDHADTGNQGTYTITTTGNLANLNQFGAPGFVVYNPSIPGFIPKTFTEGTGISITNPDGQTGDTLFSVLDDSTRQRILVQNNDGPSFGPRGAINFRPGANTSITVGDEPLEGRINVTISASTSFAPETAKYIVQTADIGLPDAQALDTLVPSVGIVKVSAGVLSTAVANTDYQDASPKLTAISEMTAANGSLIVGDGGSYSEIDPGPAGYVYTSSGTSSGWQPNQSGHPFPVVLINNTTSPPPSTMVPNTFYSARSDGNPNVLSSLPNGLNAPLPNYGDQFLFAATVVAGPGTAIVQFRNTTILYLANSHIGTIGTGSMTFPFNQAGFIWLMYIGIISGAPTYQGINIDSNITISVT